MKTLLAFLLLLAAPLAAQTIAPSQIKPGTNGQVIETVGGKSAWANNSVSVTSVFGRTGAILPVTGDYNCSQITSAICSLPTLFNQLLKIDGTALTQRGIVNFVNGSAGSVSCVDNPVTLATDCTITGGSTAGVTWSINDVSGSHSVGVSFPTRNTSPWPMFVGGSLATTGSGVGSITVAQGPTTFSMTLVDWKNQSTATVSSGSAGFSAVIAPGNYYVVVNSGAVTTSIQSWTEMVGTGGGGGGGGGPALQTNGTPNASQALLNLKAGTNVTLTDDGVGGITFDASGSGGSGPVIKTNTVANTSQSLLDFTNAHGFAFSNPSTGLEEINVDGTHFLPTNTGASSSYLGADAGYHLVPTSLPPSGSCGGDLSGTFPNCGVAKINGGAPPTSTNVVGTNSSGQVIAVPSQSADAVLASPCGASGAPTFRRLCSTDLPPGLLSMPAISTMLFDYLMPATDSALSKFVDYSTAEGSPVGVGDCPFTSGHTPTYLTLGGASFDSNPYATYSACDVPSGANGLHTLVTMIAPAVINNPTMTTIARNTILGGTAGTPYFMAWSPSAPVGSGITVLGAGPRTESTDPTDGLTCAGFVINSAGTDALYVNGNVVGSYIQTTGTPVLGTGHYLLGASFDATTVGANFFGNMYRAAGWSTLLTPGQIAQACGVLQEDAKSKGALTPAQQQNSSLTPVVVNSGDSIAQGIGGGTPPVTLMTGLPTITTSVAAIGGGIVNDNTGQLLVKEIPVCTTAAENYLISEGGSNDLAFGANAADTWVAQVRYAKLLRAGWTGKGCHGRIGVQTLLSRYGIDTGNPSFITGTTVASGGTGYNTGSYTVTYTGTCTITNPSGGFFTNVGGVINAVAFTNPGQGCTGTGVTITGSPGTGASVSAVLSVTQSGTRDTYNALLRANALSSGFDFVADAAADTNLGCNDCFLKQTYFGGDWIHPTLTGEQTIANTYSNALLPQMNQAVQPVVVTASSYSILAGNTNVVAAPTASQAFTMPTCTGQSGAMYLLTNPQSAQAVTVVGLSAAQPINGLTSAFTIPSNTQATLIDTPVVANTGGCYWTMAYSPSSSGTPTVIQVNGTPTTTPTPVNLQTSTANVVGLTVTPSNPSVGNVKYEITGGAYSGTAANVLSTTVLPNGVTATTQAANSADAKLATDNYVNASYATPPTAGYGSTTPEPVAATTVAASSTILAQGIVDGKAPVTLVTGSTFTFGSTFKTGYYYNQNATAATAITGTLPTAAAGLQYCVGNSYNGSAADTGVLTVTTSASGQFIIFNDGTLSATGGNVTSGGAGGDGACFTGIDSTHWQFYVQQGTWAKH